MKITLDLPSVLTGGAVALVLGLVAGFTPQVTQVPGAPNVAPRQITGQFSPHPSDFVWLEAVGSTDSPILMVPAGRVFVLTGCTGTNASGGFNIVIDGLNRSFANGANDGNRNPLEFPTGLALTEGQAIQLRASSSGYTWLHGYLADA